MLTVVHNEQKPFIVRAGNAIALDVGHAVRRARLP